MRTIVAILSFICITVNAQRAIVVFTTGGTGVKGNVTFTQEGKQVRIEGTVENLKPGEHGFHVHEKGDLSAGCASTGAHYNPYKKNHGAPNDAERHVGDLGNVVSEEGVTHIAFTDSVISLTGPHSILGRAVVIHSDRDDLGRGGFTDSLSTGHAGTRVACGIIGTLETGLVLGASSATVPAISLSLLTLGLVIRQFLL
ncbi:Superoxide dismutase [Cu-Zn] [Nesidiocoris tenuis]|uniref:Superoxide dismutase [Cu-Zn] n=1 Tax=Nesidiocoris tenuis TaxID=355587 RepID=A0ABN7B320_9HEMI|nr:Superoxide dismutase [Cu-Zn] [Nesidiocoris tenuis]